MHLTIRTPPACSLRKQQAASGTRFSGSPVVGRLRKPSPQIRFHLASAQASASPEFGRARARHLAKDPLVAWVSNPNEDDFCTSWLPHLPPLGRGPPFDIGTAMATFFPAPRPFCTGRPPCDINAVTYPNEFSTWSSSKAGTGQRALGFITCVT